MITILGTGNIGRSIAEGIVKSRKYKPGQIILTRNQTHLLDDLKPKGFNIQSDNCNAIKKSEIIIIAVRPLQVNQLLNQISAKLNPDKQIIISIVTGVTVNQIQKQVKKNIAVVRAMPNIAISIGESMTCLSTKKENQKALHKAKELFDLLGNTLIIEEELMVPSTVLGACGVAFFLRAIRAASQGGIQIGFHSDDALKIAAQTAKGAAELLLQFKKHPESEIDKVTTPRGCTIAGLNEMEHQGFSSSMIKGIMTSFIQAEKLYVEGK